MRYAKQNERSVACNLKLYVLARFWPIMTHWYKRSLRLKPPAHLQIEYLCSVLHSRPLTKPTNAEFYIALGWWPVKMAVPLVTWLRMSNFLETSNSHDKNETKNRVAQKQLFSLLQAWSHKVQAYKRFCNAFRNTLLSSCDHSIV